MKYKIEKIKLTKEQQQEVDKILRGQPVRGKRLVPILASKRLREPYGGQCICGYEWPVYNVLYDVGGGAKRIVRYCQKCYDKWDKKSV